MPGRRVLSVEKAKTGRGRGLQSISRWGIVGNMEKQVPIVLTAVTIVLGAAPPSLGGVSSARPMPAPDRAMGHPKKRRKRK
jgi:hypothetical protein